MDAQLHVVVGAGAVGSVLAGILATDGHRVRVITRRGTALPHPQVEAIAGDAADPARMADLCHGATALYNCANPRYHRWATDWPPIASSLLAAAERSGAVLVTTSNLYGYGQVDTPMTEQTPLAATGTKGRVRARMWLDALAAHQAGRVRVSEARGSDYLGAGSESQLGDRVIPRLLSGKPVSILGDPDVPHTWTATRDMARLLVVLGGDPRAWGQAWHVPSHAARPAREVVNELAAHAGVPSVPVRRIPYAAVRAGGLFVPLLRELPEVIHQHTRPWVMDSGTAQGTFGLQPTGWQDILADHLAPYGRLRSAA